MQRNAGKIMEWVALITVLVATSPAHAQEIEWSEFAYWDSDESGHISQAEWEGGMESLELDLEEETEAPHGEKAELYDTYREYDSVDLDEDKRIDKQEFEQILSEVEKEVD